MKQSSWSQRMECIGVVLRLGWYCWLTWPLCRSPPGKNTLLKGCQGGTLKQNKKVLLHALHAAPPARLAGCFCLTSFSDVVTSCCEVCNVTPLYYDVTWPVIITAQAIVSCTFRILALQPENHGIHAPGNLDLWPMTLAIKLIQDIIKVNPNVVTLHQTVQMWERWNMSRQVDRNTHRQTGPFWYLNLDRWCRR